MLPKFLTDRYGEFYIYRHSHHIKSPQISVLLSTYNGENWIKESIQSILKQDFSDFEFIIIDDGSTDNSYHILENFRKDNRVLLVRQKNIGLTCSLNRALSLAKGNFIARQDVDDISLPHRFSRQLAYFAQYPGTALVGTHCRHIDNNCVISNKIAFTPLQIRKILYHRNIFSHGSVMLYRPIIGDELWYNDTFRYAQDIELWCRLARFYDLRILPEVLYLYRSIPSSISNTKLLEQSLYAALAIKAGRYNYCTYLCNNDINSILNSLDNETRHILTRILLINESPQIAAKLYPKYHPINMLFRYLPANILSLTKKIIKKFR